MQSTLTGNKRTKTRADIVAAATKLFLSCGYFATDMGQIADAVSVDRRTIYRYFESKEALAFVVWTDVLAAFNGLGGTPTGNTGYTKVKSLAQNMVSAVQQNQHLIRFLGEFDHVFSGAYPQNKEADAFVKYIKTNKTTLNTCLKQGIADGSIRSDISPDLLAATVSNLVLAMCQRIVNRGVHLVDEQGYSFEMIDEAMKIILQGIKNTGD